MKPLQFSMALLKPGCLGAPLKFILATTAAMWMGSAAAHWVPANARQGQELRFRHFFAPCPGNDGNPTPEISEHLRQAEGKRVRLVGYMLPQAQARPGGFLLTARPCRVDELRASGGDGQAPVAVRVMLDDAHQGWTVPHLDGLVEVSGVLQVGRHTDADGHSAWATLQLLPETALHASADALAGYLHTAAKRRT
ncbi:MAG: hypothetical protein CFE43_12825 [Burkholderiales bacterium PBB3]|nr:MAG: hypothetical protein CFE43_12825 [Burkholderiales bacterium PBB3]